MAKVAMNELELVLNEGARRYLQHVAVFSITLRPRACLRLSRSPDSEHSVLPLQTIERQPRS